MKKISETTVSIIGAGSIGGNIAALTSRAGYDVMVVARNQQQAAQLQERGIHLSGFAGDFTAKVQAVESIAKMPRSADVIFLCTKANEVAEAARKLKPRLNRHSLVVSMQNGIVEEELSAILPAKQVVACMVGWGATMHEPGEVEMTSGGHCIIGHLKNQLADELLLVQKVLSRVVPVQVSDNIQGHLYSKLIINSCINSIGALSGHNLGQMLRHKFIRDLFIRLMKEAMLVADAMGFKVEAYQKKLDYYRFAYRDDLPARFMKHALMLFMGIRYRRAKSSSLQSLERGRPTEVDYLNGYIAKHAKRHKVPLPFHSKVITMVKEVERGQRSITPNNLQSLREML